MISWLADQLIDRKVIEAILIIDGKMQVSVSLM